MSFCVIVYLNLLIAYWPFVGDLSHSLNRGYGDNNNGTSGGRQPLFFMQDMMYTSVSKTIVSLSQNT